MYLLDSNTVSAYLKRIEPARSRIVQMSIDEEKMSIDGIIYYEIRGGLLHVNATTQLRRFYQLLRSITILWLNQDVADNASEICAQTEVLAYSVVRSCPPLYLPPNFGGRPRGGAKRISKKYENLCPGTYTPISEEAVRRFRRRIY